MILKSIKFLMMIVVVLILLTTIYRFVLNAVIERALGDKYRLYLESKEKSDQGLSSEFASKLFDNELPERFLIEEKNISPHIYKWKINPIIKCEDQQIFLLVAIASALWEFERRNIIRQTWASKSYILGKQIKYIFFVADTGFEQHRKNILIESEVYDDIVMENFRETYKNLTLKTQGQLKWKSEFCNEASYLVHVDDDVFVNIKEMVKHISIEEKTDNYIGCGKIFEPIVRREGKWKVTKEDFPNTRYPISCVGWCFVLSKDVVKNLYKISVDTHLIDLEDVTFTGILRKKIRGLEVSAIPNGGDICQHKGWPKDRPTNIKLLEAWNSSEEVEDI